LRPKDVASGQSADNEITTAYVAEKVNTGSMGYRLLKLHIFKCLFKTNNLIFG
jgi:hypothetical protein